jgi:hypothetical protein
MILFLSAVMALTCIPIAAGATVIGVVMDASGKPIQDAHIDHTGNAMVVVVPPDLVVKPLPEEVRTDAEGRFRVVTNVPAIVVRKPGYESERVGLTGDAEIKITLQRIGSSSRCKLSVSPAFKTKEANDSDYTATWFYIETKDGPKGIISGSGPMYSWGAPSDEAVWTAVEYREIMYESGVVDASGHSADGKYWRRRGIFGAAAQYYGQNRETAEQLDCVMDRVPVRLGP